MSQGSKPILILQERETVDKPKDIDSWTFVGVLRGETNKYTMGEIFYGYLDSIVFNYWIEINSLLCCPLLSPQITGTLLVAQMTWKLSTLQTDWEFGCAIEKLMKSRLTNDSVIKTIEWIAVELKFTYRIWQIFCLWWANLGFKYIVNPQLLTELTVEDCQ